MALRKLFKSKASKLRADPRIRWFGKLPTYPDYYSSHADEEWAVVLKIRQYRPAIRSAGESREPHDLARYLHELASTFNTFYGSCRILDPEDSRRTGARMALAYAVKTVLGNGIRMLGIHPLEMM